MSKRCYPWIYPRLGRNRLCANEVMPKAVLVPRPSFSRNAARAASLKESPRMASVSNPYLRTGRSVIIGSKLI